jgi:hypothetical protein
LPVIAGLDHQTDTVSRKTGTIVFRKSHIAPGLVGIDMNRAQKKLLLAQFQATISGSIDHK